MSPAADTTEETGLTAFKTKSYWLHLFESPTGYRFVTTSDGAAGDLRPALRRVYRDIFVPFVLGNPLYKMHTEVAGTLFEEKLTAYLGSIRGAQLHGGGAGGGAGAAGKK